MWEPLSSVGNWISEIAPRCVAGLTFFPCGLLLGYTLSSSVLIVVDIHDTNYQWKTNGPLLIGVISAAVAACLLFMFKLFRHQIIFCHFEILLTAMTFNVLGSIFFFIDDLDYVGSYLSYIGYGLTFITALNYLTVISSKGLRTFLLSTCFTWYLLGLAVAVSLINNSYQSQQLPSNETSAEKVTPSGIYHGYAGIYLGSSLLIIIFLSLIKVFHYLGNLDYKTSYDKELNITNSNETIFDNRSEVIKRIQFFYITRSKQWITTFALIFCDAIHFSLIFYFLCFFSLNGTIRLTQETSFDLLLWIVFLGSIMVNIGLFFLSIKIIFIVTTVLQVGFALLGIIIFSTSTIPFWIVCFLFGVSFSNIKTSILETAHLKYAELLLFLCCFMKLGAIAVINISFISSDSKDSIFYREDSLISHGLAFVTIMSLITIIIGIQTPRTFKTSLFDIQYNLWGIIFKEHQIEAMNMQVLESGAIPTITRDIR